MARGKTRRSSCPSAKVGYPTEGAAQMAALRVSRTLGSGLRAYLCPSCRAWHLTRRPRWTS